MTFAESVSSCFFNYATIKGRAPRSEFWFFALYSVSSTVTALILDGLLHTYFGPDGWFGLFYWTVSIMNFLPAISVSIRRLHDTDHSGWWYLVLAIPLLGFIVLFWFLRRGSAGENRFGPDALAADASTGSFEKTPPPPLVDGDITEQLSKIAKLHADGALTEEEFRSLKAKLITS